MEVINLVHVLDHISVILQTNALKLCGGCRGDEKEVNVLHLFFYKMTLSYHVATSIGSSLKNANSFICITECFYFTYMFIITTVNLISRMFVRKEVLN